MSFKWLVSITIMLPNVLTFSIKISLSKSSLNFRHRIFSLQSYIFLFKLGKTIENALYPTLHPQVQQFKFTSLRFYQNFMNLRFQSPSHELWDSTAFKYSATHQSQNSRNGKTRDFRRLVIQILVLIAQLYFSCEVNGIKRWKLKLGRRWSSKAFRFSWESSSTIQWNDFEV